MAQNLLSSIDVDVEYNICDSYKSWCLFILQLFNLFVFILGALDRLKHDHDISLV